MSKSGSLCGQVFGGTSGISGFGESCSGPALVVEENSGGNRTFTPGQNEFGLEGVQNEVPSMCVDVVEENEFSRDSSVTNKEKEMMVKVNNYTRNNVDGLRMEEVSAVDGSEEIGAEKGVQLEDAEKANDGMGWSDVDSSRKIEVSGDSLIVEVFGPLDGINQDEAGNSSDKQVLREGHPDKENMFEINGALSMSDGEEGSAKVFQTNDSVLDLNENSSKCDKVNGPNQVAGDDFVNKESTFVVGDLVWAKTKKNQLWWPGVISDALDVLTTPVDSNRKDSFLVKYFGNANAVWHSYSQLKHFLDEFDQLHQQNDSRNFRGAVERAICEIGCRVKVEMTCSCFSRETQTSSFQLVDKKMQRYSWCENKMGASLTSSESMFQPASFLASIKYIAHTACLPNKIKVTTTKSCLSAIYHSLGHCQIPVQQLTLNDIKDSAFKGSTMSKKDEGLNKVSTANYCNDKKDGGKLKPTRTEAKVELLSLPKPTENDLPIGEDEWKLDRRSGKGFESRERRKSKYLSYPFIDPKKGLANASTPGENVPEQADVGVKMNSMSSQCNGKKSRKSVRKKSSCCFDMLGKGNDISSSSAEILTELHLAALGCLHAKGWKHSGSVGSFICDFRRYAFINIEIVGGHIDCSEEGTKMSSNYGPEGSNVSNGLDTVRQTSSSGMPKKRKKSKEDKTSVGTMLSCEIENAANGSGITKCQEVGSHTPKSERVNRKRKKARIDLGAPEKQPAPGLPDLNSNIPASSDNQVTKSTAFCHALQFGGESSHNQRAGLLDPCRNNIKCVQLLKDVHSTGPNFISSMSQQNHVMGETPFTLDCVERKANGHNTQSGSLIKNVQPISLSNGCEPKKRKRKVKMSSSPDIKVASSIPDLNGNLVDCVSPGNKTPDTTSASPKGKVPKKRNRSKSTPVVSEMNAIHIKASNSVGVSVPASTPSVPPLLPMDGLKTLAMPPLPGATPQNGDPPNLSFMKRHLEVMTSKLEKEGGSLPPGMRTKLETEIKGFMEKIGSLVSSSPPS